jgi:biotin carboxyl carrier protein
MSRREVSEHDRLPDAAALERLADELLPPLIAHFNASGLGELEIRRGEWRVRVRAPAATQSSRPPDAIDPAASAGAGRKASRLASGLVGVGAAGVASGNGQAFPDAASGGDRPIEVQATRGLSERHVAASPGVGYFSARDGVAAGSAVRGGDVLGHVDVLGVKVEVVSPADGIVAQILADRGEAVEYGQELVRLEPSPSAAPVRES